MKNRKRRIVVILLIILIPFIPIRTGIYKDGGTTDWRSLMYRVVVWNKFVTATDETMYDPVFIAVYRQAVYYGLGDPGYKKTVGALWTEETATERYRKWYDEQLKKAGYQPTSGQGAVPIGSDTTAQSGDPQPDETGQKTRRFLGDGWTIDVLKEAELAASRHNDGSGYTYYWGPDNQTHAMTIEYLQGRTVSAVLDELENEGLFIDREKNVARAGGDSAYPTYIYLYESYGGRGCYELLVSGEEATSLYRAMAESFTVTGWNSADSESGRKIWRTDLFNRVPKFLRGQYPTEEECMTLFRNANEAGSWFTGMAPPEDPGRTLTAEENGRSIQYTEVNHDFARSMSELRVNLQWFFTDAQINSIFAGNNGFINTFREFDDALGMVPFGIGSNISLGETTLSELRIVDETHIETIWVTEQLEVSTGKPTGESISHTFRLIWEDNLWKFDTFALISYE